MRGCCTSTGQSTDEMLAAVVRLGATLGLRATIIPRWGELELQVEDGHARFVSVVDGDPTGVDMRRAAWTMWAVEELRAGRLPPVAAMDTIDGISTTPPAPAWMFALASGVAAVALAVLFGVQHLRAAAVIFLSAGTGAIVRRRLAHYSANIFLQPFCAALLAGIVGALAVVYDFSSMLRLVAVCPCMVLVPGPHVLNGALDLMKGRIHLGADRLIFAGLVIVAISTGLLVGLALFGVSLPVDPPGRAVPVWQDMIAAGLAVACYSVFFSTPRQMLAWPVAVGMSAHALRWVALSVFGLSAAIGAFLACLVVGLILTPVAHRSRMPFAAIGFASVVSMMPGVLLFRMASGLVQLADSSHTTLEIVTATFADSSTAVLIILGMSLGLTVPKMVLDSLVERTAAAGS
ncbi:MAG TPA: threonine/serine exporter family protein [Vicinamibacterales bacterium]|nr:threonine/serine exporter family protein [Vicinamibacterales bacterium]